MSSTSPSGDEPVRRSGLSGAVEAGLQGESLSAQGLLAMIGGWRGIVESLLPATVFLAVYVFTREPYVSAIAPVVISVLALVLRLIRREPVSGALSGLLGVAVCAAAVLFTGQGSSFFVPGFFINGVWIIAYAVSLLVGWPLIGLVFGFVQDSFTQWRKVPLLRRAAALCSVVWMLVFALRLAVQLPLYFAGEQAIDALGVARIVMGVPLFALAVIFTWLVLSKVSARVKRLATDEPVPHSSDE